MHEPGADFDSVVVAMSSTAGHARHAAVTIAESPAMTMAGRCEVGDVLGLVDGDFVQIGDDLADVAWHVIERLLTSGGGELLTLVRGRDADERLVGRLRARIRAWSPSVDVEVVDGGQSRYPAAGGAGVNRHLHLVPETSPPTGTAAPTKKGAAKKPATAKASGKSQTDPPDDRPPAQFWRTTGYTRLAVPLNGVLGGKTAKAFESLKLRTVGDLMLHLPRRYVSGTELSDLANLVEGDDVTVLAQVRHVLGARDEPVVAGGREVPSAGGHHRRSRGAQPHLLRGQAPGRLLAGPALARSARHLRRQGRSLPR